MLTGAFVRCVDCLWTAWTAVVAGSASCWLSDVVCMIKVLSATMRCVADRTILVWRRAETVSCLGSRQCYRPKAHHYPKAWVMSSASCLSLSALVIYGVSRLHCLTSALVNCEQ